MKVGETIAVNIGQATVQQAKIVEIDNENSLVTLVVPATRVVMSFRTELDTTTTSTDSNQHVMLGLENEATPDAPVNEAQLAADAPPAEAATPVEAPTEVVASSDNANAAVEEKTVEND